MRSEFSHRSESSPLELSGLVVPDGLRQYLTDSPLNEKIQCLHEKTAQALKNFVSR